MEISKENKNSVYFLRYLLEIGFNPDNYSGILELGQSAPNSLSRYLTVYNQYLISKKVDYDELAHYDMNGAFGYVSEGEIFVPKTLANDKHFYYDSPKVIYRRHVYSYPSIDDFSSIICYGYSIDLNQTLKSKQDKYFGLCIDKNDVNQRYIHFYRLLESIKCHLDGYELINDEDRKTNKEFILLKRKN